jgi:LAO/AO transport system kinase
MASPDPPAPPEGFEDIEPIVAGVRAGERAAVARALNLVEDRRPESRPRVAAMMRALGDGRPSGRRVGFTGPPGVGKSSLVNSLAHALRARGVTVGVLAVDPSSKRSGGALLGDRARIDSRPEDQGLFVRSLATAGQLGGLARAAPAAALVLSAAFDWVLVETVGVGQSETDVEYIVDTVVFVVQPGSGDSLQFLKAGIMEIPDVLLVNKSDVGEPARRARVELLGVLGSARSAGIAGDGPEVLMASATRGDGLDEVLAAIERHRESQLRSGGLAERRLQGQVEWGVREFVRRVGDEGVLREGGLAVVRHRIEGRVRAGGGAI